MERLRGGASEAVAEPVAQGSGRAVSRSGRRISRLLPIQTYTQTEHRMGIGPAPTAPTMTVLLDRIIYGHGGISRWNQFKIVKAAIVTVARSAALRGFTMTLVREKRRCGCMRRG